MVTHRDSLDGQFRSDAFWLWTQFALTTSLSPQNIDYYSSRPVFSMLTTMSTQKKHILNNKILLSKTTLLQSQNVMHIQFTELSESGNVESNTEVSSFSFLFNQINGCLAPQESRNLPSFFFICLSPEWPQELQVSYGGCPWKAGISSSFFISVNRRWALCCVGAKSWTAGNYLIFWDGKMRRSRHRGGF